MLPEVDDPMGSRERADSSDSLLLTDRRGQDLWRFPVEKDGGKMIWKDRRYLEVRPSSRTLRNVDSKGKVKWECQLADISNIELDAKDSRCLYCTLPKKTYSFYFASMSHRSKFAEVADPQNLLTTAQQGRRQVSVFEAQGGKIARFSVRKSVTNRVGMQRRILEIDSTSCTMNLLSENLRGKWTTPVDQLEISPSMSDTTKLRIRAPKKEYTFFFESESERKQFVQSMEDAKHASRVLDDYDFEEQPLEKLSVCICSWNLGNTEPPVDLSEWIQPGHDVYAIGVQEGSYTLDGEEESWKRDWSEKLDSHFDVTQFYQVAKEYLWQMSLTVYVKREHLRKISNVQKATEATGIAHVCGNKGGIGVCMKVRETPLVFVSSHLAAFQEGVENRNMNFAEIIEGLRIGEHSDVDVTEAFPYCFWFGDLNYRIDLPREQVIKCVENGEWQVMQQADQLWKQRLQGKAFQSFKEGPLNFPPTYRYLRNIFPRQYNDEKARIPAWCDRVLWRSQPGYNVSLDSFGPVDAITTSDHSPVRACFKVDVLRAPQLHGNTRIMLSIMNLKAYALHLASDSTPDVYLSVVSPCLASSLKTETVHSKDPSWDSRLQSNLVVGNLKFISHQNLIMKVKIASSNKMSSPTVLGYCVVPLSNAVNNPGNPAHFCLTIRRNCVDRGTIEGEVLVSVIEASRRGAMSVISSAVPNVV